MEVLTGEVIDVIDIHNEFKTYEEFKESLDEDFFQAEERFVIIGYKLKAARDTDILKESGYKNVNEFAKAEYDLDKSQVSRFMRINDMFSENGYSKRLDERYRGFGSSKLAIMLLLPAEINEELSGNYSKAEIQTIREEVDEEKKTSDLEVMLEEKDEGQQGRSALGKVLYQLGRDDPEMYLGMYEAVFHTVYDGSIMPIAEKLMDVMAPAGEAIISVRIAGEGGKMLSIKGADTDPVLVDVRSGEKQTHTWVELVAELDFLYPDPENARRSFEMRYGEPFPEKKAEVAPVQPAKEQHSRKVSRVTKAKKPEKTRAEAVSDEAEERDGVQEDQSEKAEEQKEQEAAGGESEESRDDKTQGETCADGGQTAESSADPESADTAPGTVGGAGDQEAKPEQETASEAADINPETTSQGAAGVDFTNADGFVRHVEKEKANIRERLLGMESLCGSGDWDGLIEEAGYVITLAESIKNMEEVFHG